MDYPADIQGGSVVGFLRVLPPVCRCVLCCTQRNRFVILFILKGKLLLWYFFFWLWIPLNSVWLIINRKTVAAIIFLTFEGNKRFISLECMRRGATRTKTVETRPFQCEIFSRRKNSPLRSPINSSLSLWRHLQGASRWSSICHSWCRETLISRLGEQIQKIQQHLTMDHKYVIYYDFPYFGIHPWKANYEYKMNKLDQNCDRNQKIVIGINQTYQNCDR